MDISRLATFRSQMGLDSFQYIVFTQVVPVLLLTSKEMEQKFTV